VSLCVCEHNALSVSSIQYNSEVRTSVTEKWDYLEGITVLSAYCAARCLASTRVQGWGKEAPKEVWCGDGVFPTAPGDGSG